MIAVDIAADLNAEDQTGYVWVSLEEVRDPSIIVPGALVIAGDDPTGTIVHLDILPGAIDDYLALARRIKTAG